MRVLLEVVTVAFRTLLRDELEPDMVVAYNAAIGVVVAAEDVVG